MVDNNDIRTITGGRDRGIEGSENQPFNEGHYPGETEAPLIRIFDPAFEDGFNEPRGGGVTVDPTLPNTRDVSNIIADQGNVRGNPLNASDWLWQWGQFLDHDLGLSEGSNITADPDEEFGIPLSPDDALYGRNGVVFTEIPVARIPAEEGTGVEGEPRTVVNEITSFIDGSNGYGSTYIRAAAKRTDLGFSFFGQSRGEIVERDGQQFLEVEVEEESPLEIEGEEGSEDQNTTSTVLVPLPPEGARAFDGKLLVANDSYGTDGLSFAGGSDPNNDSGEILAPYNRADSINADPGDRTPNDQEFISGDIRINEQIGLISIHTLFIREHNLIADKVAFHLDEQDDPALNAAYQEYRDVYVPSLNLDFEPSEAQIRGEFIYEAARAVVAAKNQVITYEEFLPLLIGNESAEDLQVIDESIMSPDIAVEFSGAAFRLGHTLLSDNIRRVGKDGTSSYSLRDAFFTPQTVSQNGVDDVLLGLNYQESNDADPRVIDGVRNNLFGREGQGGQDLVAINLQRGRELGIPGYVEVYNQLNPDNPIATFEDLNPLFGEEVAAQFVEAYDNVEDIDLWLGALAEIPEEGVLLGPTFSAILSDQFARLKQYDRFFYSDQLADEESFLSVVSNAINLDIGDVRLADVIRDNVANPELVPDDAFRVPFENQIFGTDGNENIGARDNSLIGTDAADLIDGRAGNDRILGRDGDDIIFGGRGADELSGQGGADTLIGGAGDDTLKAQGSGDVLSGNGGNDQYEIYLSLLEGEVEITEEGGLDSLIIETAPGEEGVPVNISLSDPAPGRIGIKKSGTDLLLDINQDGVINPDADLTITNYFNEEGGAGRGVIETIGEGEAAITSQQILEYGQRDDITGGFTVYRFFIPSAGVHFYTANEVERDSIIENLPNYDLEGASYVGAPHDEDVLTGAKPVYRFFNQDTGVHLYTISDAEREAVLQLPNYSFEGVAYYAYEDEQPGSTPLYRFYNSAVDTHFYTPSAGERDSILQNLPDYQLEGGILEDGTVTGINYYIQPLPEG